MKERIRRSISYHYHNKVGFSMAEMMMAVAIIGILAAVSFISVINYLRSMTVLERDGIAKEIFVAAQNHLAMVESQDYSEIPDDNFIKYNGTVTTEDGKEIVSYYFVVNHGDAFSSSKLLSQILPFGSIDETVRLGGNYIIHYSKNPARILNVFYTESSGSGRHLLSSGLSAGDVGTLIDQLKMEDKGVESRKHYTGDSVVGYFGEKGAESLELIPVSPPKIEVENNEILRVKITDSNVQGSISIRLTVEAEDDPEQWVKIMIKMQGSVPSDPRATLPDGTVVEVSGVTSPDGGKTIYFTLDDITNPDSHFCRLCNGSGLVPGEDITVSAEAWYSGDDAFSNIAKSEKITENSLYATNLSDDAVSTVHIAYIRHLENLDSEISKVNINEGLFTKAVQIGDLSWTKFKEAIQGYSLVTTPSIYEASSEASGGTNGYYYPVTLPSDVSYSGSYEYVENGKKKIEYFSISDIEVDNTRSSYGGAGGLFKQVGSSEEGASVVKIKDLELINFNIIAATNAGALAAEANNAEFENIVAYRKDTTNSEEKTDSKVVAVSGSAGGLIGKASGGSISKCGVALTVQGTSNVGGLVGEASACDINNSYSGGQTDKGVYTSANVGGYPGVASSVTSGTVSSEWAKAYCAGGFIGKFSGDKKIENCYSTCSVSGETAGGFIGSASGEITNCYSTGLVNKGVSGGGFAGFDSGSSFLNCYYLEVINGSYPEDETEDYIYLGAIGEKNSNDNIKPYDSESENDYFFGESSTSSNQGSNNSSDGGSGNGDSGAKDEKRLVKPYDTGLLVGLDNVEGSDLYNSYPLKSYPDMLDSSNDSDNPQINYMNVHYGDWPTPEILVINE